MNGRVVNRPVGVEDLFNLFSVEPGITVTDVFLEMLDALKRMEHMQALDLVMRHGTPEQQQAARQHMLNELTKQAVDGHG
jgi:hypothetical protein